MRGFARWAATAAFFCGAVVLVAWLLSGSALSRKGDLAEVPGPAPLDPMALLNEQIDRTNFIVADRCSGTYISAKHGLILTNWHCVTDFLNNDGTPKAEVVVKQGIYRDHVRVGERSFQTTIAVHDKSKDLALLQFKAGYVPHERPAPLLPVDGTVTRGERIYIVGNPAMFEASIVEGIVSSVTRNISEFATMGFVGAPRAMFQYSGGAVGGNSGGALYNAKGELIGVPTMASPVNEVLGFAVPVFLVRSLLREYCFADEGRPACKGIGKKAEGV